MRNLDISMMNFIYAETLLLSLVAAFINIEAFSCSFDKDTCGFTQKVNDNFDWTRHRWGTSSQETGPNADNTSGKGLTTSCSAALGMEDGRIQDDAITASSVFRSGTHDSFRGRLNNNYDDGSHMYAWTARVNQAGEYLQVDLGRVFYVTKVATQGREYPNTKFVQWVKTYSLQYGLDGVTWDDYMTGGARKVFNGNTDTTSIVTHILAAPIKARFVRIVIESWNQRISMRAELYGCQV